LFSYDIGHNGRLKAVWHSLIITWEKVLTIFASDLKMTMSRDLLSVVLKGQALNHIIIVQAKLNLLQMYNKRQQLQNAYLSKYDF